MPPAFAYTHRTATPTEDLRDKPSFCELSGDVQIVLCAVWCVTIWFGCVIVRSKIAKITERWGFFRAQGLCDHRKSTI